MNSVSGDAVRRAALSLVPVGSRLPGANSTPLTAASGPDGSFVFENIPPGTYRLSAGRTGFVEQEYGARSPFVLGTNLELGPGHNVKGVEFKLTPQGVITGKVFDTGNDPVADVSVSAFRRIGGATSRKLVKVDSKMTNDLGEFRITGLPGGNYILVADRPSAPAVNRPRPAAGQSATANEQSVATYYPGSTDPAGAIEIPVGIGQETSGRDIQLRNVAVFAIRGQVSGPPAIRRSVQLFLLPSDPAEAVLGFQRVAATPAPDGSFALENVQPGSFQLIGLQIGGWGRVVGVLPVEVGGGDIDGLVLPVSDPADLSGVLRIEGEHGPVPAGIAVALLPEAIPFTPSATVVQKDGSIHLESLSPLLHRVKLTGLPPGTYVKSATAVGKDILETGLDLRGGSSPALEVVVSRKAGAISGTVRDGDKAAPGSVVVLVPEGGRRNPLLYHKVNAAESGDFEITGITPGTYHLCVLPEDADIDPYLDAEFIRSFETTSIKIVVTEGAREKVDLRLPGK